MVRHFLLLEDQDLMLPSIRSLRGKHDHNNTCIITTLNPYREKINKKATNITKTLNSMDQPVEYQNQSVMKT